MPGRRGEIGKRNLIPPRTSEEARELGRKGGKKSGEVRRARKTMKEELLVLLSTGNTQSNVTVALIQKAIGGDVRAFEVIRDTIGERPTNNQDFELGTNADGVIRVVLTD